MLTVSLSARESQNSNLFLDHDPECFEMYNQACMFDAPDVAAVNYNIIMGGMLSGKTGSASQCQECRACEEKCPQGIEIRKHLKEVAEYFGS
jgi:uncharacterized protein